MTLDDRIRRELTGQSARVVVAAKSGGLDVVMSKSRARTRRARIIGSGLVVALVVGAAALAGFARDSDSPTLLATDETQTEGDPAAGASDTEASAGNVGEAGSALESETSAAGADPESSVATTEVTGRAAASSSEGLGLASEDIGSLTDLVPHKNGFLALGADQNALWFTLDGNKWSPVTDPRPSPDASMTLLTSYKGAVHVGGHQPNGRVTKPWLAASTDLDTWEPLAVPSPGGEDSDLVDTYTRLSALASGPAGLIVTGETLSDLALAELLDQATIDSESWSLGDSSGDLSKLIVYADNGDVATEIDLLAAGIPVDVIDRWTNGEPVPFIAVASDSITLSLQPATLPPGTLLAGAAVTKSGFASGGLSPEFSERVLWESSDGANWESVAIEVATQGGAETLGSIGDRLVVVSAVGPILTVQHRSGGEWAEARLDPLFDEPDSEYQLIDLAFDPTGAVAVVATTSGSQTALWVLATDDGVSWTIDPIDEFVGDSVSAVGAVGISANSAAVTYQGADGAYNVALLNR